MNPTRLAILGVALVAAIGLAIVLRNMAMPKHAAPILVSAPAPRPTARVLVAAKDLQVGDRLTEMDMAWQPWPADALNPSFITDGAVAARSPVGPGTIIRTATLAAKDVVTGGGPAMRSLDGSVVREAMVKGEPIIKAKVVRAGDGGYMSVVLAPGMRAISVPVNAESGAGGFIEPGDRIDLVEAHQDTGHKGGTGFISDTVLSNVRVLAVDQTTVAARNGKSILGATLTLEVPEALVEMVAEAKARGGLTMALRSYADLGGGPGSGGTQEDHGVRLFRGGDATEVMVSR